MLVVQSSIGLWVEGWVGLWVQSFYFAMGWVEEIGATDNFELVILTGLSPLYLA